MPHTQQNHPNPDFLTHFESMDDPRQQEKVVYPLHRTGHPLLSTLKRSSHCCVAFCLSRKKPKVTIRWEYIVCAFG